jgi:Fe-S oxidoreductase
MVSSPKNLVAMFADTFTNFHEPEIPRAAVEIAEALGCQVTVPPRACCGRPLISKGFLDDARRQAEACTRALAPLAESGTPIVFCEPGCYSAVRDDHPYLLRGELARQAQRVAAACRTFDEWAVQQLASSDTAGDANARPKFVLQSGPSRVLLHTHCHQRALVGPDPGMRLLSLLAGCQPIDLDAGCCGMAGSFGYEREHYELSRAIAERKLLPAIHTRPAGSVVVAPGFSCRHQIAHFAGVETVHPAVLLRSLLL